MKDTSRDSALAEAERLARRHESDPGHAEAVTSIAGWLFDATKAVHGLGQRERWLLCMAAWLHDTGLSIRPSAHHKGSRDVIMEAELPGLGREARTMIACIARYHRKALPKPSHKLYCDLEAKSRSVVNQLAALLRIADGLDRSHNFDTQGIRAEIGNGKARLLIAQRRPNATDIWGATRKCRLFEEEFGLTVEIMADEPAPEGACHEG